MKRSHRVSATLVVTVASGLAVTGCDTRSRDCVDAAGRIIPDTNCQRGSTGARWIPHVRTGGFGGFSSGSSGSRGFFGG